MNTLKHITILASLFLLVSCGKEMDVTPQLTKAYPGVAEEIWPYFAKFEKEAAKRGFNIDLAAHGITGTLEHIEMHGTVGLCNHRIDEPNRVILDKEFWKMANPDQKELIVFHELGHCYLGRGHHDGKRADGSCTSIMRSGRGGCIDMYHQGSKDFYLDELYKSKF